MKKRIVLAAALLTICLSACAKESTETGGKVEESTKEADVTEESTQVDLSNDENVIEKEPEEAPEDTEKVSVEISDEDWENLLSYGNIFAEYTFGDNMDMLFRYYIYHWKEVPVDPILQVEADPLNRLAPYVGSGSVVRIPAEAIRWIGNHIFKLDNVDYAEERYPEEANIGGAFYQTDGYYYYCEVDYAGWEDCIASSVLNYSVLDDGKIYVQIEEVTPSDRYSLYLLCELQNSEDKRYWVFDEISKEPILSDDVFTDNNISKDSAYKDAYVNFIVENCGVSDVYDFIYLDEDDIPEVVIAPKEPCHADSATVYTYANGKVVEIGVIGSYASFLYEEKSNYIISNYSGMGMRIYTLLKIDNQQLVTMFRLSGVLEEYRDEIGEDYYIEKKDGTSKIITEAQYEQYEVEINSHNLKTYVPNPDNTPIQNFIYDKLKKF